MNLLESITYNLKGQVSEYEVGYLTPDLSEYNEKRFFEYNAVGQITKNTPMDFDENIISYSLYENKDTTSSNESYLIDHGLLPIDLSDQHVLPILDGGVGSVEKIYYMIPDNSEDLRINSKSEGNRILFFNREARLIVKQWTRSSSVKSGILHRQSGMQPYLINTITTESVNLNPGEYPELRTYGVVDFNGITSKRTTLYQFDCSGR